MFRLPLVGDDIEYKDAKNKSAGYEVVGGEKTSSTVIPYSVVKSMGETNRRLGRQKQNTKKKQYQLTTKPQTNTTVE